MNNILAQGPLNFFNQEPHKKSKALSGPKVYKHKSYLVL